MAENQSWIPKRTLNKPGEVKIDPYWPVINSVASEDQSWRMEVSDNGSGGEEFLEVKRKQRCSKMKA